MDYLFIGDQRTAAGHNPILGTYDNGTDTIKVYNTKRKGVVAWLPRAIGSDLEALGYGGCRVSIKTDQEKAVMAVKRAVAEERSAPTAMLESPVRESQCNGKMEKAVQKWQGQFRNTQAGARGRHWEQDRREVKSVRVVEPLGSRVLEQIPHWG